MAALAFFGKYREGGLLLFRVSIGLILIILIAPVLWNGQGSWERIGSAMRHLDFHAHFTLWGFGGSLLGCVGGVLIIIGLCSLVGISRARTVATINLVVVWVTSGDFHTRLPALEMAILLLC